MHIHAYIHTHIGPFILRRMLLLLAHHTFALLAWGDTWYYQECYWFRVVSLVRSVHQSRSIRHSAVWYSTVQCSVAWHSTVLQSTTQSSIVHVWYVAVQYGTVRHILQHPILQYTAQCDQCGVIIIHYSSDQYHSQYYSTVLCIKACWTHVCRCLHIYTHIIPCIRRWLSLSGAPLR